MIHGGHGFVFFGSGFEFPQLFVLQHVLFRLDFSVLCFGCCKILIIPGTFVVLSLWLWLVVALTFFR